MRKLPQLFYGFHIAKSVRFLILFFVSTNVQKLNKAHAHAVAYRKQHVLVFSPI